MKKIVSVFMSVLLLMLSVSVIIPVIDASAASIVFNNNEWEVLKLTNKERLANGLQPLSMAAELQNACEARETQIVTNFSHYNPDGSSAYVPEIQKQGMTYSSNAENLAKGQKTPDEVVTAWMNSEHHRFNILQYRSTHIGLGYNAEHKTWVQLFSGTCTEQKMTVETNGIQSYEVGTSIDDFSGYISLICAAHGGTIMPLISEICTGYNPSKTGIQTITVHYNAQLAGGSHIVASNGLLYNFNDTNDMKYKEITATFKVEIYDSSKGQHKGSFTETTTAKPTTETTTEKVRPTQPTTVKQPTTETTTLTVPKETSSTFASVELTSIGEKVIGTISIEFPTSPKATETTTIKEEPATQTTETTTKTQPSSESTTDPEILKQLQQEYNLVLDNGSLAGNLTLALTLKLSGSIDGITIRNHKGTEVNDSKQVLGTGYTVECEFKDGNMAEYTVVIAGDVDGSGTTTAADARIILRCAAGLAELPDSFFKAADLNNDGKITAADARTTLRVSAKLEKL